MRPRYATLSFLALVAGCGRYADFTLPPLTGGSAPRTFEFLAEPQPVLARGDGWESRDALNPSVIRTASGLLNLYSGFDGRSWQTGLASSTDGLHWDHRTRILSPDPHTWEGNYIAANGAAAMHAGQIRYWYVAGPMEHPSIGLARSNDGREWHKESQPVVTPGPYQSWDEYGVADPYIVRIDPYFYLYYLGQDRAHRQRLGVARSTDGIHFQKLRANPILEIGANGAFDDDALGEPAVFADRGFYWMLYTGRDVSHIRRLGLARSTDGVHFTKLSVVFAGTESWNSKVLCDPTVLVENGIIRVWFGGGNAPQDAENLNGQIGYGTLKPIL